MKYLHFYCQMLCGEVDFSIEQLNKTQEEIKTLTPEQKSFVMQALPLCKEQCSACAEIVFERRLKTKCL